MHSRFALLVVVLLVGGAGIRSTISTVAGGTQQPASPEAVTPDRVIQLFNGRDLSGWQPDFAREHHELLALAAPRPFLLVGGDSADGTASWPWISAALPVYRLYGEPARLGLLHHHRGHAVPADVAPRLLEWIESYA